MHLIFRTNLPKEVMAYPDFPFLKSLPSFMGHREVKQYLDSYADRFGLLKYIKVRKLKNSYSLFNFFLHFPV